MIATMDRAGRLVIASDMRREAALEPGTPLEIRVRDSRIEIEPRPMEVKLVRKGHLLVARPKRTVPPLSGEVVERVRRQLRRRSQ